MSDAVAARVRVRSSRRIGFKGRLTVLGRGFLLSLMTLPTIWYLAFTMLAMAFIGLGFGILILPLVIAEARAFANQRRCLAAKWQGIEMTAPYRPRPEFPAGTVGAWQRCMWILTDPATWRDLLWMLIDPAVGLFLAFVPVGLVLEGVYGFVISLLWKPLSNSGRRDWYFFTKIAPGGTVHAGVTALIALTFIAAGFWCGPAFLRANGRWTRLLLAPTASAEMALRVQHLTTTRTDAVDTQAAELRRIERDLHDGAQARLVAMGMNLNAAAQLMEKDPDAARALLVEARDSSARALTELRDLVRGIHPPVLADRGLGDAIRALALDNALKTEVSVDLPGRLEAPLESAAYFAVGEALTNAAKHSGAGRVWIDVRHADGLLRVTVTDDGVGGADIGGGTGGTGLSGIERRLATFDGIIALSSPLGGPTVVTMELPCALSSPKTSSS